MKKILLSPEMIGFVCFAIFIAGLSYALRGTDTPVSKANAFSLYEWNYSTAKDGATIAQIFGPDTVGNHAIIHIRMKDKADVYIGTHEQEYITPGRKYTVSFNGHQCSCEYFKANTLKLLNCGDALKELMKSDKVVLDIVKDGRTMGEYEFKPIQGLLKRY